LQRRFWLGEHGQSSLTRSKPQGPCTGKSKSHILDQLAALGWVVTDRDDGIPIESAGSLRSDFREVVVKDEFFKTLMLAPPALVVIEAASMVLEATGSDCAKNVPSAGPRGLHGAWSGGSDSAVKVA
jgi:hypothetical protein